MEMTVLNRNLLILVACEAMAYSLMAIVLTVSAVAGYYLAPDRSLVLLPLVTEVFGACLSTIPAAYLMNKLGRRHAFLVGSLIATLGACLCSYAVYISDFWLLVASTTLLGALSGFGEYTRYAAADLFTDEERKGKAVSLVVSGGIVAAFVGPSVSSWSNDYFAVQFLGPFLVCVALCLISFALYACLNLSTSEAADDQNEVVVPIRAVLRLPAFVTGTTAGVVAFLSMAVLMDAVPMTMLDHGFHYDDTTQVIQWHLLAMFAPSWITGKLIERYGTVAIILLGIAINTTGVAVGIWGAEYVNFFMTLLLIGLGWNFMFVAGTTLIATIRTDHRSAAEGASNFLMSSSFAIATPIAAYITVTFGWVAVCLFAGAMLGVALLTAALHMLRTRSHADKTV